MTQSSASPRGVRKQTWDESANRNAGRERRGDAERHREEPRRTSRLGFSEVILIFVA